MVEEAKQGDLPQDHDVRRAAIFNCLNHKSCTWKLSGYTSGSLTLTFIDGFGIELFCGSNCSSDVQVQDLPPPFAAGFWEEKPNSSRWATQFSSSE